MLKFLVGATALATTAQAGIEFYEQPSNGATTNTKAANTHTVLDPIGVSNDIIDVQTDGAGGTYIGLFTATVPSSHTEQATGGPVTKVECIGVQAECQLPLYILGDKTNPVPAGDYHMMAVNGDDSTYSTSIICGGTNLAVTVTVDPYIAAWGSTLMQTATSNNVERGDDLLVMWDGLAEDDVIEYRHDTGGGVECPVDYYTITAADETAGRGTIALKTSGGNANLVGFAIPGVHSISAVSSPPGYASADTAACLLSGSTAEAVVRQFTVQDSDTIAIGSTTGGTMNEDHEAGTDITLNYNLGSASTAGMYVGIWKSSENPSSHVVDRDYTAGHPLSTASLPVGISGAGTIQLSTPIDLVAGVYIVYIFNSNDDFFEPVAETSYSTIGSTGPHVVISPTTHNTDVTVISSPTGVPSGEPSGEPTGQPSNVPTSPTGQPTGIPTSSPSFVEEPWGEYVWTEKRHRKAGMCENQCSGHGTCEVNGNCKCFTGLDGEDEWTGPDCSSRTCPFDFAWVGAAINSNNLHPWAECSNKGTCDRSTGECQCFTGYEGAACQRTVCPDNCNDQGTCWPEKHLASKAGRVYDAPWDAMKHVGCLCDAGYRGPACDQQECPSGADPLAGYGNEAGRDCSGRGICDYSNGICACFTGFFGTRCQHQTTVM